MRDGWEHSSRWKATPVIALVSAIALLVAGVAITLFEEQFYKAQKAREAVVQAQILAESVTAALVFGDAKAAQDYVNALKANPELSGAGVYDQAGALVASFVRGQAQPLPDSPELRDPLFANNQLSVVLPVRQMDNSVGAVYLRLITEPLERRLARYGGIMLLVTMAALVVIVLGVAQTALRKVNAELEDRARALADANRELRSQIGERQKAEEALRQSQKMEAIGQLSGGIAHDFNNLLTAVRGNLQLLQKRISEGRTDVKRYIDFAIDGLNRASNVTQRILAFSRRQPLSPKPVNLNRLVGDLSELLRHSVGDSVVIFQRLKASWWTLCDANQMESVVLNLAINARDAMPEGGQLIIETENLRLIEPAKDFEGVPPGDYVKLLVIDTGAGMSPEILEKAFDPFFTTKPQGQGTGLGLSMIFGYVKQSGGHIVMRSQLGKGTTVSILMPRHDEEGLPEEVEEAVEPSSVSETAPPTILVVEDEPLVRMVTVETLNDEGFHVLETGDGSDALRILESDVKIDLLISDVRLPGLSGYQLAEAGVARRSALKVLLMTGYTKDPIPEKMVNAGARIIYKPFSLEELTSRTHQMLNDSE